MFQQNNKETSQIKWIILFILLLIPFSIALEDKLVIRLHAPQELSINLYRHLYKQPNYYVNHTDKVEVTIEKGTAKIIPIGRFTETQTIIFAINESVLEEKEELVPGIGKVINLTKLIQEYPRMVSESKTKEIFNETINFLPMLRNIEERPIEKLYSKILGDQLFVVINDEVEINISLKGEPRYSINLLTGQGPLDEEALKLNLKKPLLIFLGILILIPFIIAIRKVAESSRIKKPKRRTTIKGALRKVEKLTKVTASTRVLELIESFFMSTLSITRSSSFTDLTRRLKKEKITGNLKQELIFLFEKLKEGALSEHETELAKKYLKRATKLL